ncbi:metal-dependent phosphohydrolase HD sub domain protein [Natrinema pellirubrum DSM 15624]|uniref:5'-deoxynucleotidase n=1 Tax=Natrinema pellirubrum (strain DSM 15624 / CIP 106293 / JCM 10476 / NCIMB 786 / 157) TaxID=797303 RepID=L0JQA6_NATP1|nr:HD family hydrolase [Natrinema pellirubrum]AGB33018.1 putative HD superfamily hydrolase [Natrinema pellirubrum DSM 15624]ELY75122.1 metal-dependent phosphohydrolase HD sub domain protein [Natrinema pellirubrum DSM 15624]
MADELDALLEALELKDERRTGWDLRGIDSPESVAAHTWGVATLCLYYADRADGVDRDRAVSMALLHDLGEARIGDIATRAEDDNQRVDGDEKVARERDAITDLLEPFDGDEFRSLWAAYEARETQTARFVKDMDLIDNCLQALKYERGERYDETERNEAFDEYENLDEFFATAAPRLRTPVGERLFEAIKTRYEREIGRECQL